VTCRPFGNVSLLPADPASAGKLLLFQRRERSLLFRTIWLNNYLHHCQHDPHFSPGPFRYHGPLIASISPAGTAINHPNLVALEHHSQRLFDTIFCNAGANFSTCSVVDH
jgi:hypothetical protein